MKCRHLVLMLASTGLSFSGIAVSDEHDCPEIEVRESPYLHAIWYGHENPEMIPDFLKYRMFELRYNSYLTELTQHLTTDDHAILMTVKSESDYWREVEGEEYKQGIVGLCARSAEMDPVAVATESEQIALDHNKRTAARMKDAIDSLSLAGHRAVVDYIELEITPNLTYPQTNSVTLAEDDPDSFLGSFAVVCYTMANQDLPPEIKKAMECNQDRVNEVPDRKDQPAVGLFPQTEN